MRKYTSPHVCDTMAGNALERSVFQVLTGSYAKICRSRSAGQQFLCQTSRALHGRVNTAGGVAGKWQTSSLTIQAAYLVNREAAYLFSRESVKYCYALQ